MNDKIDEFALQSQKEYGDFDGSITALDYRKFAELIIKECSRVMEEKDSFYGEWMKTVINEHFGVE